MPMKKTHLGDDGWTTGVKGREPKNSLAIKLVGELDELSSHIGLIRQEYPNYSSEMHFIQDALMQAASNVMRIGSPIQDDNFGWTWLKTKTDDWWDELPELKNFIYPDYPAEVHVARAVCRRVERAAHEYVNKFLNASWENGEVDVPNPIPGLCVYLNRLSDFLFCLARRISHGDGHHETTWHGKRRKDDE